MAQWEELKKEEAYKLSMAEFKGTTIEALQQIRGDVRALQQNNTIKGYINYGISGIVGMVAGIFGSHIK
jgi:hypothetical protein